MRQVRSGLVGCGIYGYELVRQLGMGTYRSGLVAQWLLRV